MTTPFGQQPAYADLVQQLADLRAEVAKPLTLDDLPLADLRSKLIENGDPLDLSVLALPGQVADFGRDGTKIKFGPSPAFTWSGGFTTIITVPHGLNAIPQIVLPTSARPGDVRAGDVRAPWGTTTDNYTATTFDLLFTTNNSAVIGAFAVPAGACYWVAIA